MRRLFIRWMPLIVDQRAGIREDDLPIYSGETVISAFVHEGRLGVVFVYTEKADRRHFIGGENNENGTDYPSVAKS